eukprot:3938835-Rhodomonas_salina.1
MHSSASCIAQMSLIASTRAAGPIANARAVGPIAITCAFAPLERDVSSLSATTPSASSRLNLSSEVWMRASGRLMMPERNHARKTSTAANTPAHLRNVMACPALVSSPDHRTMLAFKCASGTVITTNFHSTPWTVNSSALRSPRAPTLQPGTAPSRSLTLTCMPLPAPTASTSAEARPTSSSISARVTCSTPRASAAQDPARCSKTVLTSESARS